MASYTDLKNKQSDDSLLNKIEVAVWVVIDKVLEESDTAAPFDQSAGMHDKRVRLAKRIYPNFREYAKQIWPIVLAANKGSSIATIESASDANFQTNVENVFDEMANGISLDEGTPT